MMQLPRLTEQQLKDVQLMQQTEGWRLVKDVVASNIGFLESSMRGHNFRFDDEGEIVKKSVLDFQKKQDKLSLLKSFLHFLEKPGKVLDVDREIFD